MRKTATIGLTLGLTLALSCGSIFAMGQTSEVKPVPGAMHGPSTSNADNTKINMRDKTDAAETPPVQSNKKADTKLLADVRRAVTKDKSLSVNAHNIKILAASGAVTLRGPVESDDEKTKVDTLVKAVAGVTSVDNKLDVKAK